MFMTKKYVKKLMINAITKLSVAVLAMVVCFCALINNIVAEAASVSYDSKTYTTDANGTMAFYKSNTVFDLIGKFNNQWKKTTYSNAGFTTCLKLSDSSAYNMYIDGTGCMNSSASDVNNMKVTVDISLPANYEGKVLQFTYVVKNNNTTA